MPSSGGQTCALDRKSTRLNSSHTIISYAVFCLKKTIAVSLRFLARNYVSGHLWRTASAHAARGSAWLGRVDRGSDRRQGRSRRRFFFNDTATTEIYTLSLHDALPI